MIKIIVNLFYEPVQGLKDILVRDKDIYIPVNGGASLKNDIWCRENCFFDDDFDGNISGYNGMLNEMTSVWWTWKNLERIGNPDHIGFNHYRRFFNRDGVSEAFGTGAQICVAKPIRCPFTLKWQYQYYHCIGDLLTCFDVMKPEDAKSFDVYLNSYSDNFAPMNMFVMERGLFEEWCGFIFPILFELEKRIDVSGRDNYQKRAVCFLCERLFGWWCHAKKTAGCVVRELDVEEHLEFKNNHLNERGTY